MLIRVASTRGRAACLVLSLTRCHMHDDLDSPPYVTLFQPTELTVSGGLSKYCVGRTAESRFLDGIPVRCM